MTDYREILRLCNLGFSERNIALSCPCSRNTVSKVISKAMELDVSWPLPEGLTNAALENILFPKDGKDGNSKRMPNYAYVRKELLKNGVNRKLLWTEYMEECRLAREEPLMYSQFCYHIQLEEQKHRAAMHIGRKPGEQIEVDWAGDPAHISDPDTGEIIDAHLFIGVMTYSQYVYVEAFINEKQQAWITAHVHMFDFFGGTARILVPDNCKTAVVHNNEGWYNQQLNTIYHEMAEHYSIAIIPARVRKPRDKPNAEGSARNVSTWITAAFRNEPFFSLTELNHAIREKLQDYNAGLFQKKEGSRLSIFRDEEMPLLAPLPSTPYELAEWKQATVQFNYHISIDSMLYSIPFEYIKRKVDVRITEKIIEVFYNQNRIASHRRLLGRKGQYSTILDHMPIEHQKYLEWNGDRFRKWSERIGINTYQVVNAILASNRVEQQTYRACMGLLRLAETHSVERLEEACKKALSFTSAPSYKIVKSIFATGNTNPQSIPEKQDAAPNVHGITRGVGYYGGTKQ